ncbi:MAG: Hsp20 family protein [Roseovarius sp.]|nr:Hsp20 family protein [Roseovarius sp.]MCY4291919.1 Hsp20 family protein [Roseovarius sp.]MCY4315619.1 Hsp20 family protein [Roseovarius sp.]
MRNFDFAPLYRATIGFDRVADIMDRLSAGDASNPTYPPYNIEKTDENSYRISIAVAGFSESDLSVEVKEGTLVVSARKSEEEDGRTYLHRGIANRAFDRKFQLADHVRVTGAAHADGMLHINLVHELPEALKPRSINIISGNAAKKDILEAKQVN